MLGEATRIVVVAVAPRVEEGALEKIFHGSFNALSPCAAEQTEDLVFDLLSCHLPLFFDSDLYIPDFT